MSFFQPGLHSWGAPPPGIAPLLRATVQPPRSGRPIILECVSQCGATPLWGGAWDGGHGSWLESAVAANALPAHFTGTAAPGHDQVHGPGWRRARQTDEIPRRMYAKILAFKG
jgi:hypothetical protein